MKNIISIIVFCAIFNFGFSEELIDIRIVKILDSNLFLSEDSIFIKLAEIQSPSLWSKDSVIAKKIIKYANTNILEYRLSYLPAFQKTENDTLSIYLYREYDFGTTCFNERYLEEGFGKYQRSNNLPINRKYIEAEEDGQEDEVGIWQKNSIIYPRSHQIIFKINNKFKRYIDIEPVTLRQFIYTLYKPNKIFHFSMTRFFRQYFDYESSKVMDFLLISRIYSNSENTSIGLGLSILIHSGESSHAIFFPTGEISYQFFDNFRIHSELIDDDNLSFWSFGFSYKIDYINTIIKIGRSYGYEEELGYFLNGRASIFNLLMFQVQGKYYFKNEYGYLLFGIGLLLNE